ncbi:MAG: D-aminoacylase [Alphaproteobacteria bacterium]|jgi:N-acyl-D-amino-acid deacylase|nr:D-aminoacylase [Alphaproteobacteria bacterium]
MSEQNFDLVIRNGTVIDGTGGAGTAGDIGVVDDRITAVGDLGAAKGGVEIDAAGKVVAPGFIDVHTHDDHALLVKPDMAYKTSQGVTTVVAGNCGISLAPLAFVGDRPPPPLDLLGDGFKFPRMADFVAAIEAAPAAVNATLLCGHTTLRVGAMDALDRAATDDEIDVMRDNLAEALEAGAVGMSTGLAYAPAQAAPTEEVVRLAELLGPAGAVYTTHLRNEGAEIEAAMEEAFHIGRSSGAPVVLSHHKVSGRSNFGKTVETLKIVDRARAKQAVDLDVYPYHASSTVLQASRVGDSERVLVTWSEVMPEAAGRDLAEIADEMGCSRLDAAERLQPAGAIYFMMDEDDVRRVITYPHSMIASDGLPHDVHPHPRLWGTFPRVLGHYSRELGLLPLEDAVHRMTGRPARVFGLAGRGEIRAGNFADLVVFDPETVIDRADFEHPTEHATGIEAVFVNGRAVWREGAATGARPGHALKRQEQQAAKRG